MSDNNDSIRDFINLYASYIRENQRLYRYVIENSSDNERALQTLITTYINTTRINRVRARTNNTRSYFPRAPRENYNGVNTAPSTNWSPFGRPYPQNLFPQFSGFLNPDMSFNFLNPVTVRPTTEVIQLATTTFNYSELPLNERLRIGNRCSITLDDYTDDTSMIRINYCGHVFSESGLNQHFLNNVRCPICRHDIRDMSGDGTTENNTNENNTNENNTNENNTNENNTNENNTDDLYNDMSSNLINIRDQITRGISSSLNILNLEYPDTNIEMDISNNNVILTYSFYTNSPIN